MFVCVCLQKTEDIIRSTKVPLAYSDCKPQDVGAGNEACVLCKSSQHY